MKKLLITALLAATYSLAYGAGEAVTVYKDKNCGCCDGWVKHLQESGFKVKAVNSDDMSAIKKRYGVPESMNSCHTAVLDKSGQVIEGHVPAAAINKLIARPGVKGVAVPGMAANSPGMGKMDGNLITYDFAGKSFSKD
ncbi:MAG: CopG family transcriptional regulator [Burkholderiales bacterium RIFCSPLOWO2_02_FULL_57_36]|nr:MAG: CopG family transcriptional regulator [Burkholderiales bacterium RIFCSPLOWO2_02_FULL_57_36]